MVILAFAYGFVTRAMRMEDGRQKTENSYGT
jgi:hypothetical protein